MRSINRERAVARLQSEFVSAVSHEFRTPLTSLRQFSEMLAKGRIPEAELRQKSYDILSRESERLQRLVESLLDFGRIEARAFRYRFEPLDPGALVSDVVGRIPARRPPPRAFDIELESAGGPSASSGPIARRSAWRCGTSWTTRSSIRRNAAPSGSKRPWKDAVWPSASGIGAWAFRPRSRRQIFQKFVRGTGSRAAHIQGTGIGLGLGPAYRRGPRRRDPTCRANPAGAARLPSSCRWRQMT